MIRSISKICLSLCFAQLLLSPSTHLTAVWTTPEAISTPGTNVAFVGEGSLDLNDLNNAVVVWTGGSGPTFGLILGSSYTFNVGWTDPVPISSAALTPFGGRIFTGVGDPQVTLNEANQALAVWEAEEFYLPEQVGVQGVYSSTRSAEGTWAAQERISARNVTDVHFQATDPRGAINDSGFCFAVWKEIRRDSGIPPNLSYIMGNFKQIGGSWGTPFQIAGPFSQSFTELTPDCAMNNNNDIVVVWMQDQAGNNTTNVATYDGTTNTWSLPLSLPPLFNLNQSQSSLPHTAIDPSGNAVVTWLYETSEVNQIYAASFTKASGWGPSILLAETTPINPFRAPYVVMDPFGKATVIWDRFSDAISADEVFSSFLPLGGTWSSPQLIASPGRFVTFQILTPADNDPAGNVIAIYEENNFLLSIANFNGLGWQPPEFITGFQNGRINRNIQYGSCGFAIAQWEARDEDNFNRIWVSLNFDLFNTTSQNFTGRQCCERFATQKACFNELTWTVNECVSTYLLFRNGVLIATIPREQAGFFREIACTHPTVYTLIAVSSISSTQSPPVTVTLP